MSRAPDLDLDPGSDPAPTGGARPSAGRLYRLLLTKDGRRRGEPAGYESAGRILAVMVVTFAGAALVNADAMVERAERKPLGDDRDRALAIWHPVQDVAQALQLDHLRTVADEVAGDDGSDLPAVTTTVPDGATTTTVPVRPELRAATAEAPLRVWVGGDSMMRDLSESVERLAAEDPTLDVTAHYEISSGLTRPDYYDWPAALATDMSSTEAEVAVVMFGANDGQGIVEADGTVRQSVSDPGWAEEYRRRVDAVMDQLYASDRLVLWVLQPPMRDGEFDARVRIINDVYRDAAEDRPWVELVETAPVVGADDGSYDPAQRQGDGIHLSREGADTLAQALLDAIEAELPSSTPSTTTTTAPADD